MTQPQETATPAVEQPVVTDSAPVAGDTQAGATTEDAQAGVQSQLAAQSQPDEEAPEGFDSSTWNALPKAEKKKLNTYFTQRTQKLSAREKEVEQTLNALNTALQQNQPAAPPPGPSPDQAALLQIEQQFGPEVARAFDQLTQARVAPVLETLDRERTVVHAEKLKDVWDSFRQENPDVAQLEPVMTQIAQTFRPQGVPMKEYFGNLRLLALSKTGQLEAEIAKKVTARITSSARAAEPPSAGVSPSRVSPSAPDLSKMSTKDAIRAAAQAAKEGIRWNSQQ